MVWGQSLTDVLSAAQVAPDVEYERPLDGDLAWLHRRVGDADVFYLTNTWDRSREIDVRFRVSGKEAEIWRPDTGAHRAGVVHDRG